MNLSEEKLNLFLVITQYLNFKSLEKFFESVFAFACLTPYVALITESRNVILKQRFTVLKGDIVAAPQNYLAVIKVVGIGGGGVNAINRMIDVGLKGVEFIAINTDAQHLLMSDADVKLDIGRASTKGLGAGAAPEKGRQAAIDHTEDI